MATNVPRLQPVTLCNTFSVFLHFYNCQYCQHSCVEYSTFNKCWYCLLHFHGNFNFKCITTPKFTTTATSTTIQTKTSTLTSSRTSVLTQISLVTLSLSVQCCMPNMCTKTGGMCSFNLLGQCVDANNNVNGGCVRATATVAVGEYMSS